MSAIGWVDFSSEHREKVKSVIDLLSTPGVIDELGIGVIGDSFSDSLFTEIRQRLMIDLSPMSYCDSNGPPASLSTALEDSLDGKESDW